MSEDTKTDKEASEIEFEGDGESLVFADGFEDAFIGVARRYGYPYPVAAYDYDKCVEILMDPEVNEGITEEGARDFLEYNVLGAWVGEMTPVFIHRQELKDLVDHDD